MKQPEEKHENYEYQTRSVSLNEWVNTELKFLRMLASKGNW